MVLGARQVCSKLRIGCENISSHSLFGVLHWWQVFSHSSGTQNLLHLSSRLLLCHLNFLKALKRYTASALRLCWRGVINNDWFVGSQSCISGRHGSRTQMGTVLMRGGKLCVLLASRRLIQGIFRQTNKAACTCTFFCYLVCFSLSTFLV